MLGHGAGAQMTTGYQNTVVGHDAGCGITTGCRNVAIGEYSMSDAGGVVTGTDNVAIGRNSLTRLQNGNYNVAIGLDTGCCLIGGCHNIWIGHKSGYGDNRCSYNAISIGCTSGASASCMDRTINIGMDAARTGTCTGCLNATMYFVGHDNSDCRAKRCIATSDLGLDFINAVRPVKFKYKVPRDLKEDDDGNIVLDSGDGEGRMKSKQWQYGFIAQELETVISDMGKTYTDFAGIVDEEIDYGKTVGTLAEANADPDNVWFPGDHNYDPGHSSGIYQKTKAIRDDQFTAPVVKAIQELDAKNTALAARVATLEG
jgi:hypothetical protein